MILGLGIDLVEVERLRKVLSRYGQRFLHRVYTERERELALSRSDPALYLAAVFAAKEAASKALGTGLRGVGWRDMEVRHEPSGKPYLVFYGRAKRRFEALGALRSHVSLSHERGHAVAVVLLEGE